MRTLPLLLSVLLLTLVISCSSTNKAVVDDEVSQKDPTDQSEEDKNWSDILSTNRSALSDVYASQKQDIPTSFLQRDTADTQVERDPFDGYRVQIVSTREVTLADSVSREFRLWADTTMTSYQPKTYVFFNPPYYKVHIGDFQTQDRALQLSNLIKRKYPEAWVVHDRIDPSLVPADTTKIDLDIE